MSTYAELNTEEPKMSHNGKNEKTVRVGIYVRVSTSHQNVDMQLDELRTTARQRGWTIVAEYVDEGVSGSRTDRPGLDRLMEDARSGRFNLLAVWKLDRLGRSLRHLLSILDELAGLDVGFISLRDSGFNTVDNAAGKLMISIVGAFCEYERQVIRERSISGIRRAQAAGKHCGRPKAAVDIRPIESLQERGHSIREIAGMLGVSRGTVWRRLNDSCQAEVPAGC